MGLLSKQSSLKQCLSVPFDVWFELNTPSSFVLQLDLSDGKVGVKCSRQKDSDRPSEETASLR